MHRVFEGHSWLAARDFKQNRYIFEKLLILEIYNIGTLMIAYKPFGMCT